MAVELSYAKGTAASAAKELGINESMLGKWRRDSRFNSRIDELNLGSDRISSDISRNLEQENKLLRKALKDATCIIHETTSCRDGNKVLKGDGIPFQRTAIELNRRRMDPCVSTHRFSSWRMA